MGGTAGTERECGALTSLPTLQRRRPRPDLRMAWEGRGRPHAQAQLTPQPRAGGGGGGGWRQAGFHTVNYSVVNSAPRRGGGRESESEPSHSGAGTALSEEAGAPALILSGAKGPAGGQAQWGSGGARPPSGRLHWPEALASRSLPIAGPGNSGGTPRRDGGQVSQGWQHVQAAAHGPAGKLCGSQTPQAPLELQDWQTAENFLKEGTLSCSAAAEPRGQVWQSLQGKLRGCAGVASPPPWLAPPGWPSTTWASSFVRILLPWTCLGQSLAPFLICLETDEQGWGAKHQVSAACGAAGLLQSWGASGSPPQGKGGCEDRAGGPGCLMSKAAPPAPPPRHSP